MLDNVGLSLNLPKIFVKHHATLLTQQCCTKLASFEQAFKCQKCTRTTILVKNVISVLDTDRVDCVVGAFFFGGFDGVKGIGVRKKGSGKKNAPRENAAKNLTELNLTPTTKQAYLPYFPQSMFCVVS